MTRTPFDYGKPRPRTAPPAPESVDWNEPSESETGEYRTAIERHKAGERVELSTSEEGCAISIDDSGLYEVITLACPGGEE